MPTLELRGALFSFTLLLFGSGCGGSSSETPPPLRPHPLHEAYRRPRVVEPPPKASAPSADPTEEPEVSPEPEQAPPPASSASGPASQTWGPSAPPPLPESELK